MVTKGAWLTELLVLLSLELLDSILILFVILILKKYSGPSQKEGKKSLNHCLV